ncbi:MAG: M23 family metallopeptidase, partial [Alphaproteobacteria bacterium]
RIRHNATYSTAYGHLRAIARGIRRGRRVRQGQTIGFVGSTGRSTGPHLHYEVLRNNRQTNPLRLKLPTGKKLAGAALNRFLAAKAEIDKSYAALDNSPSAQRNPPGR